MDAWRQIETAPKDGTSVLLWEKYSDSPVVGFYHSRREKWFADTEHYDTDGNACVIDKLSQDLITHWMPLPAAPSTLAPHP